MKSLLLVLTLVSFTIYKAEQNNRPAGVRRPSVSREKPVPAAVTDADITAAFEGRHKNKS